MPEARIFYFTYDHNRPKGGQKHGYQHVDILNRHGFDASALHMQSGFRLTWFHNTTRVTYFPEFKREFNPEADIIVLPEDLPPEMANSPGRKVIFNKNLYHGFSAFNLRKVAYPYLSKNVIAALAVSEHNKRHLEFAYPELEVIRVYCGIDTQIFRFVGSQSKKAQIATINKGDDRLATIFHILDSRAAANLNSGRKFQWAFLRNASEEEVARVLGESAVFLFPSVKEGLPRLPLEAMACGCLTAGYGSGPLKEVLLPGCHYEYGEELGLVQFIENAMAVFPERFSVFGPLLEQGRNLASSFSLIRQEESVVAAWRRILNLAKSPDAPGR